VLSAREVVTFYSDPHKHTRLQLLTTRNVPHLLVTQLTTQRLQLRGEVWQGWLVSLWKGERKQQGVIGSLSFPKEFYSISALRTYLRVQHDAASYRIANHLNVISCHEKPYDVVTVTLTDSLCAEQLSQRPELAIPRTRLFGRCVTCKC
jgi:hypothetical protein